MSQEIKASLDQLYREDERPWLVGLSSGKDSTMLASLIFHVVLAIPAERVYHECTPGRRKLAVKVVDIFGNDTMTIVEVTVGKK
jgi:3'-phosphoadenosine 5'-phosphosulfate sulfotransferase (PAPS reductase)/FAD synthetase